MRPLRPVGGYERHYVVAVEGQVITYECKAGHTYKIDHSKGPRRKSTARLVVPEDGFLLEQGERRSELLAVLMPQV